MSSLVMKYRLTEVWIVTTQLDRSTSTRITVWDDYDAARTYFEDNPDGHSLSLKRYDVLPQPTRAEVVAALSTPQDRTTGAGREGAE